MIPKGETTTLSRTSLAKEISAHTPGLSEAGAVVILECVIGEIAAALRRSGDVTVPGFGRFRVKRRVSRWGINPHTKERQLFPAKTVVRMKLSAWFEGRVIDAEETD